jgi:hypothetical protein
MRRVKAALGLVWRGIKWLIGAGLVTLVMLLVPVAYVEVTCRGTPRPDTYRPLITDEASRRLEANSYLTYPEWHIVFAYDGLAESLETGDEHAFGYYSSVGEFWRSTCALMRVADSHGGADGPTRTMIHTIGVSFTAEMAAKAVYEETIGRATAWLRGPEKTRQDAIIAGTAAEYAAFLRQTPWYRFPFGRELRELWGAPAGWSVRAWERRIGIGIELAAKSLYARVIERAVAATGEAALTIRSVVAGLDQSALSRMADVKVIGRRGRGLEIETPRYARFTEILAEISRRGGTVLEIAGNDDVMVTLTVPRDATPRLGRAVEILRLRRDGFPGDRLLVDVKVSNLSSLLASNPPGDPGLEHVFDY